MDELIKKIPLSHFRLIKRASNKDWEDIKKWLTVAYNSNDRLEGYDLYRNLNGFITDAFADKNLFVLRYKRKAVAFLTFSPPSRKSIRIIFRIVCVKPDFLRMGLATLLLNSAIEYYQKRGCLVAELWEVNSESKKLGKSMGFIEKKEKGKAKDMFKILIDSRKQNRNANIRIVAWDDYTSNTNKRPLYSWSLNFLRDKQPIVCKIGYEWTIGIIQKGKIVYADIAKNFFNVIPSGGPYMYINEVKAQSIIKTLQDENFLD